MCVRDKMADNIPKWWLGIEDLESDIEDITQNN